MENENLTIPGEEMEDMADIIGESNDKSETEVSITKLPSKLMFDRLIERTISEHNFGMEHASEDEKSWLSTAYDMVQDIWEACSDFTDQYDMETIDQRVLMAIPTIMLNILNWKPTTVIFGNDDEWVDEKEIFDAFSNKEMWFTEEHVEGTSVVITSVEKNIRFPSLRRFNHDNKYAHILDAVYYVDKNGEAIDPVENKLSPIRFIEFPYRWRPPVMVIFDTEEGRVLGINGETDNLYTMPKYMIDMLMKDHPEYFETDNEEDDDMLILDEEDE